MLGTLTPNFDYIPGETDSPVGTSSGLYRATVRCS